MFFDKDDTNIDSWGISNEGYNYQKVLRIDENIKRQ